MMVTITILKVSSLQWLNTAWDEWPMGLMGHARLLIEVTWVGPNVVRMAQSLKSIFLTFENHFPPISKLSSSHLSLSLSLAEDHLKIIAVCNSNGGSFAEISN